MLQRFPVLLLAPAENRSWWLGQAKLRSRSRAAVATFLAGFFGCIGLLPLAIIFGLLIGRIASGIVDPGGSLSGENAGISVGMIAGISVIVLGTSAIIRAARSDVIRRSLRAMMTDMHCLGCDYDLTGLVPNIDGIVCPECGEKRLVIQHAVPGHASHRRLASQCMGCEYSLAQLPENDGEVTCPECGLKQKVDVYAPLFLPDSQAGNR